MKKNNFVMTMILVNLICLGAYAERIYPLMTEKHATGRGVAGITGTPTFGAYAIKTNGYEFENVGDSYDPAEGPYEIWSMTFGGTQTIRKFTLGVDGSDWFDYYDGFSWTSFFGGYGDYVDADVSGAGLGNPVGTSIIYATESDLGRVASADPDFSTGVCNVNIGGSITTGGFVLNPAPLTFNGILYDAGELALITSITGATDPIRGKVVLLYDLRQIGEYTDRAPDYNTGQDGLGNQTPLYGAYNQTDWNDCFYPLVTRQMVLDTISPTADATTFNYGRQAVWAPDASAIYFAGFTQNRNYNASDPEDIRYWNGIWKYDFAENELVNIKQTFSREDRMYYCEMAAVHTDVRDFTGGVESGIQILFASEAENVGGISCIVDNGQVNPTVYTVISPEKVSAVSGKPVLANNISNIAVAPEGDIYFYATGSSRSISGTLMYYGPYAVYCYDTTERLYSPSNRAQHMNFLYDNGVALNSTTGAMGAFQYYDNLFGMSMLTFRSTPLRALCGINIGRHPLDFNNDGEVDIEDLVIFRDQRINNDRWLDPLYSDLPEYAEHPDRMPGIFEIDPMYINCDLTGNSMYRSRLMYAATGEPVPLELIEDLNALEASDYYVLTSREYFNEKVVTETDADVLYEFIPAGDANLDGYVNLVDFAALAANFGQGNSDDNRKNFSEGDFNFDGVVDINDVILLMEYWLSGY